MKSDSRYNETTGKRRELLVFSIMDISRPVSIEYTNNVNVTSDRDNRNHKTYFLKGFTLSRRNPLKIES